MDANTQKHLERLEQQHYEKIKTDTFQHKCFDPFCSNPSIKSHILQKERIIKHIANPKVISLSFSKYGKSYFKFERIEDYRNKYFYTFPGFCQTHDSKLFEEIEPKQHEELPDLNQYTVKLKFSFRAFINVMRDTLIKMEVDQKMSAYEKDKKIQRNVPLSLSFQLAAIQNLDYWRMHFRNTYWEMQHPAQINFTFHVVELPKIDICCSNVFFYETPEEIEIRTYADMQKDSSLVFFTLLTIKTKTVLIIGCHNKTSPNCKAYVNGFLKASTGERLKLISDKLLLPGNQWLPPINWICSTDFYEKQIKPREQPILEKMNEHFEISSGKDPELYLKRVRALWHNDPTYNDFKTVEMNLFEGMF